MQDVRMETTEIYLSNSICDIKTIGTALHFKLEDEAP